MEKMYAEKRKVTEAKPANMNIFMRSLYGASEVPPQEAEEAKAAEPSEEDSKPKADDDAEDESSTDPNEYWNSKEIGILVLSPNKRSQ
jgi:hypothetical protein